MQCSLIPCALWYSYEAQKSYYTQKIQDSPDWEMAGIYADEGITGTSLKK